MRSDLPLISVTNLVGVAIALLIAILITMAAVRIVYRVAATMALRRWRRGPPVVPEVGPCTLSTLAEFHPDFRTRDAEEKNDRAAQDSKHQVQT